MSVYKELIDFVDDLIRTCGKIESDGYELDLDDLSDEDQYKFAALYWEANEKELDFLYKNEDSLIQVICNDNSENLKKLFLEYHKPHMSILLSDRLTIVEKEDMYDMGFMNRRDRDTGESHWVAL